ncbi:MAG: NADH:flavin oxidoreductase/NADH oxidase family protein [Polyangiales bacterium]
MTHSTILGRPLTLPCGATLRNRIAKAAMSEHLATRSQSPNERLVRLYAEWSRSGAGMLLSGNVMVDPTHLESVRNVAMKPNVDVDAFVRWAAAGTSQGNHFWMQLNHPGRQTPASVHPEPCAPSAGEAVDLFKRAGAFASPRAMTAAEVDACVVAFANAAAFAQEVGFTGVQVHGAHGYLVNQFLTPLVNKRSDHWGGPSIEERARFLRAVIRAIRDAVGPDFPIGLKLNSTDFQHGGFNQAESMEVLKMMQEDSVDLVEISGGSYEARAMFDGAEETRSNEVFFLDYAEKARALVDMPMMVTGGFRTRSIMEECVESGWLDVVGMARPFTNNTRVAQQLLDGEIDRATDPPPILGLSRLKGAGTAGMSIVQMAAIANGRDPTSRFSGLRTLWAVGKHELSSLKRAKKPHG